MVGLTVSSEGLHRRREHAGGVSFCLPNNVITRRSRRMSSRSILCTDSDENRRCKCVFFTLPLRRRLLKTSPESRVWNPQSLLEWGPTDEEVAFYRASPRVGATTRSCVCCLETNLWLWLIPCGAFRKPSVALPRLRFMPHNGFLHKSELLQRLALVNVSPHIQELPFPKPVY